MARRGENICWSKFVTDLEQAAARNDTFEQYRTLGELNLKKKRNTTAENVKRSDGTIITGRIERMSRWKEYFKYLVNRRDQATPQTFSIHSSQNK